MPENQNIEWKLSWRDEYLKWICGFANAQGGRIYIGVNDDGIIVGISDYRQLMEDIPNKSAAALGILPEINLLSENEKYYIEINVAPSFVPVNYRGEYHYRCGSTKQVLKGNALNDFLLRKTGSRWDAAPMQQISLHHLDSVSFDIFKREAKRSGRLNEEDLKAEPAELLERLHLSTNGYISRAAALLFHPQPDLVQPGCYVKIGRFSNESELLYHDEFHGSLIRMADEVIRLLFTKYLKATIRYDNEIRIERYPYPRSAIREIFYNALVHSNWSDGLPIQIRVDDEKLIISNSCVLPWGWTLDDLTGFHVSRPYNPLIARTFFRAGYIEAWGRGISTVRKICTEAHYPLPQYIIKGEDMSVIFPIDPQYMNPDMENDLTGMTLNEGDEESRTYELEHADLSSKIISEIRLNASVTQNEIASTLGISRRSVQIIIKQLVDTGKIQRIGSKKSGHWMLIE